MDSLELLKNILPEKFRGFPREQCGEQEFGYFLYEDVEIYTAQLKNGVVQLVGHLLLVIRHTTITNP